MKFINHLVRHRKIDRSKVTSRKPNAPQRSMIDLRFFKIALDKIAIHKRHIAKETPREITIFEGAMFKLGILNVFLGKHFPRYCLVVDEMITHGVFLVTRYRI